MSSSALLLLSKSGRSKVPNPIARPSLRAYAALPDLSSSNLTQPFSLSCSTGHALTTALNCNKEMARAEREGELRTAICGE